jgi:hypothetical protein
MEEAELILVMARCSHGEETGSCLKERLVGR